MAKLFQKVPPSLVVLFAALQADAQPIQSPRKVLDEYCRLDLKGTQLEPLGWLRLARMFVPGVDPAPGPLKLFFDKVKVIREYTLGEPAVEEPNRTRVPVRYATLGEVDYDSLTFSPSKAEPTEETESFTLLLTTRHFDVGKYSEAIWATDTRGWRIVGLPPRPHLSVDAAVSFVTQRRDQEKTPEARESANATIGILNRLR